MNRLREIVERNDTPAGRTFDFFIQAFIILSLLSFSVETLPSLTAQTRDTLYTIEVVTVGIFTAEYLLRILVAEKKWSFVFSFFGMIDLLAILPFYITSGIDLRSLRAFRLLRLFRAFRLVRYSRAIQRFHRAILLAKEELLLFLSVALLLLFFSAVGIYYFEREAQPETFGSVFHSLWWALTTLTTVGYGDMYPVTVGGKLFTFFVLLIGLAVVALPCGLVASSLAEARRLEAKEEENLLKKDRSEEDPPSKHR